MFGRGSGMRGAGGPVGVGVGVDVWVRSVEVEVGLAMSGCVGGAGATFVGVSSVMIDCRGLSDAEFTVFCGEFSQSLI